MNKTYRCNTCGAERIDAGRRGDEREAHTAQTGHREWTPVQTGKAAR